MLMQNSILSLALHTSFNNHSNLSYISTAIHSCKFTHYCAIRNQQFCASILTRQNILRLFLSSAFFYQNPATNLSAVLSSKILKHEYCSDIHFLTIQTCKLNSNITETTFTCSFFYPENKTYQISARISRYRS